MSAAGTFKCWGAILDKHFHPLRNENGSYNTFDYGVAISFANWMEASFVETAYYMHKNGVKSQPLGYYNQDRHVNFKFLLLKEQQWRPGVAIGWDDIGNFRVYKSFTGNNQFECFYIVVTKHTEVYEGELGLHISYRNYASPVNHGHQGVMGGLTLRPNFFRQMRFIAEWDGEGMNLGADALLYKHLFVQASIAHFQGITASLSYHFQIPF